MTQLSNKATIMLLIGVVALVGVVWVARRGSTVSPSGSERPATSQPNRDVERRLAELGQQRHSQADDSTEAGRMPLQASSGVAAAPSRKGTGEAAPQPANVVKLDTPEQEKFDGLKRAALSDTDPQQRIKALALISSYDNSVVVPVLKEALSDPDAEVRLAAIQEVSDLGDDAPLSLLQMALDDPDPEVRMESVSALDDLSDDEANKDRLRPLIEKALNDPDEDVRSEAEDLAGINSPDDASD